MFRNPTSTQLAVQCVRAVRNARGYVITGSSRDVRAKCKRNGCTTTYTMCECMLGCLYDAQVRLLVHKMTPDSTFHHVHTLITPKSFVFGMSSTLSDNSHNHELSKHQEVFMIRRGRHKIKRLRRVVLSNIYLDLCAITAYHQHIYMRVVKNVNRPFYYLHMRVLS